MDESARRLVPLQRAESLRLLGTVTFGRVVFTRYALPAITPVPHLVDGETIVVRCQGAPPIVPVAAGRPETVVAYEADVIDPITHVGWSVVATGVARPVVDAEDHARYRALLPQWLDAPDDQLIRITPEIVNGFRFANGAVDDTVGVVEALPT